MLRLDNNKYIHIIYNKSKELYDARKKSYSMDNQFEEGEDSEEEI